MEALIKAIKEVNPNISQEALEMGLAKFELKSFKAKDIVLEKGKICDSLLFPVQSITRCFYEDHEGEEQTLWMKPELSFITEYKSFVHQEVSQFSLQFYEDTECYCIDRFSLLELYQKHSDWALFGVFLTEKVHITLIDVFVNLLANDATRNYQYIEYAFPRFIQVAPLKDIASMLQISPVSLSRIRAGRQSKKAFS